MLFNRRIFNEVVDIDADDLLADTPDFEENYTLSKRLEARELGYDYDAMTEDERDEKLGDADFTDVLRIDVDGLLFQALMAWYKCGIGEVADHVRSGVMVCDEDGEREKYLYIPTTVGYDVFDQDVLGGNGDGTTVAKFIDFLNSDRVK